MRYKVNHAYTARRDGTTLGPWQAGDVIELDEADAEWVERDSPGALTEAKTKSSDRQQEPTADRQHRGGRNRASS